MKTSVMEVRDMLSVLSVSGVEKRIGEVPGVESVTVNYAAGNATVRYDETRLDIADIKSGVRQGGYEADAPLATPASNGHEGHTPPGMPSAPPASATPKSTSDSTAASAAPAGDGQKEKASAGSVAPVKAAADTKPAPSAAPTTPKAASDAAAASAAPAEEGKKENGGTDKS
jgi:Cu2+-exporting ATPase